MIDLNNIRISVYSDTLFRVEYQPQRLFEDNPTLLMGTRKPTETAATVKKTGNSLRVRTKKCELVYQKKGEDFGKDLLEVRFDHGNETRVWDRSCQHSHPVPQVHRCLDEWPQGVDRHSTPIIINNDGWHVITDNAGAYWNSESEWPIVKRRPYYQNLYLFCYGRDIGQAFADFIHLLGRPPLLPRQTFGAWYSRWYDYKDKELLQLLAEYEKHQLGLDVLVVDVDWHRHHWNGYDWRQSSFPSPKKFIAAVKAKGLKLVLNDHPGYNMYDPLPEDDNQLALLRQEISEPPYKGMWACDWSRASIVEKWERHCLGEILRQGIDWWWIDGWGDRPFPDIDEQLWLNWQYYRITRSVSPKKRALVLSRWGGIGSHRYPVQFSGDTHSTFAQLDFQIYYTAYSGGLGAYYWSHDLGGFHEEKIDEELYLRWIQFGAFSPIFRTHSNHGIREPFNFSDQALAIYRKYIRLRYGLLPYFEQLHFRNHLTGWPLLTPLSFTYPNEPNSYRYTGQYFLGDYLLVAPVGKPLAKKSQRASKHVWLPPGQWLDGLSGRWITGGRVVNKRATIDQLPFFIKQGAIITTMPYQYPVPTGKYREIFINIFAWKAKAKQELYFDDGESYHEMEPDKVSRLDIDYQQTDNQARVRCRLATTPEYLPQIITFVSYAPAHVLGVTLDRNPYPSTLCNENTFSELIYQKIPSVRWSIVTTDLQPDQTWVLNFKC